MFLLFAYGANRFSHEEAHFIMPLLWCLYLNMFVKDLCFEND